VSSIHNIFHKKWYADYFDNQFPKAESAHGAPRDAILPSGFQVPLDITHPTGQDPGDFLSPSLCPTVKSSELLETDTHTNIAFDDEGQWIATQDIAKDTHIVLLLQQFYDNYHVKKIT
jgi:hypothetical protein